MSDPASVPPLPDRVLAEELRDLDDAGLEGVVAAITASRQATEAAMAPFTRQMRELGTRAAEVATEQRRRERASRHAARIAVREQAASGEMPGLADVLAAEPSPIPADRALREVRAFLRTGGEVRFGFATKPGYITFTDGRQVRQAGSVGEARALWADGWEAGAPGVPGVRVHLVGSRVERVTPPDQVVVDIS